MHLVCFGLGYTASVIARVAAAGGADITGTRRAPEAIAGLAAAGWRGLVFDGDTPGPGVADELATATHVLVSPAPDADGCPVLRQHRADILEAPNIGWIGYLSTVGVYGDHSGAWIDETSATKPVSERSRRRVLAENQWLEVAPHLPQARIQIFRLAGIYGPGRSAVDDLIAGTARRIVKPGQVFNRIHVDDIALTVSAAMSGRGTSAIYNVTDDEPAPPQDVVAYAADLMGLPVPPEIPIEAAGLSPMGLSFYGECKRVSNARLKAELVPALTYPSYREGMRGLAMARTGR